MSKHFIGTIIVYFGLGLLVGRAMQGGFHIPGVYVSALALVCVMIGSTMQNMK